ncbi:MAG: ribosome silencing factor [Acidobacteria bacterium]|jgi:ribosome-associated protein|nr:ribosome silencing factor [Acidobacteriota bacterium]
MAKTTRPRTKKAATPRLPSQLKTAVEAARGKKATEALVLDLRKTAAFTDFFLICTGSNPRQVHAIADGIEEALKAKKVRPTHVEGYQRAEWILLDYFDFVVHVFSTNARQFYGLDRLWGEAIKIELPDDEPEAQRA